MSKLYQQALEIYSECCDMDMTDYADQYRDDIRYIIKLIRRIGYNRALIECLEAMAG